MTDEELLQIIKQAAREGATELDLSDKDLRALPTKIEQLASLGELHLGGNQLTILPTEIGQLTSLRTLKLSNNKLTTLPQEILQLTNLSELKLSNNNLTTLPPKIGQLANLSELNLSTNNLTTLPPEIGQLTNLSMLDLSRNRLTTLPPEIGQLTNLSTLNLNGNNLTKLPPEISQLTNLSELHLGGNQLVILPSEIGQLTNLIKFYLIGNQLKTLPPELLRLTQLRKLDLRKNVLPIPPEILGHDWSELGRPATILNYYFQLQHEKKRPLNEAKLLVVGQATVGKTSLVKRLIEGVFDKHERKTEGIQIQPWQLPVKEQTIASTCGILVGRRSCTPPINSFSPSAVSTCWCLTPVRMKTRTDWNTGSRSFKALAAIRLSSLLGIRSINSRSILTNAACRPSTHRSKPLWKPPARRVRASTRCDRSLSKKWMRWNTSTIRCPSPGLRSSSSLKRSSTITFPTLSISSSVTRKASPMN